MARLDPPPVTAKISCDGCGRQESIATKQSNLPPGWATVAVIVALNVVGSSPSTRNNPHKEMCPICYGKIQKFMDEGLCSPQPVA
jgi:hypothetical protein